MFLDSRAHLQEDTVVYMQHGSIVCIVNSWCTVRKTSSYLISLVHYAPFVIMLIGQLKQSTFAGCLRSNTHYIVMVALRFSLPLDKLR